MLIRFRIRRIRLAATAGERSRDKQGDTERASQSGCQLHKRDPSQRRARRKSSTLAILNNTSEALLDDRDPHLKGKLRRQFDRECAARILERQISRFGFLLNSRLTLRPCSSYRLLFNRCIAISLSTAPN
jgi:hypothetical protein